MIHYKLFNSSHCEFLLFNGSICNIQHSTEGRLTIAYYASFGIKRFIYQSAYYQVELSGALQYHCHMAQRNGGMSGSKSWWAIWIGYWFRFQTPYRPEIITINQPLQYCEIKDLYKYIKIRHDCTLYSMATYV